MDKLLVRFVFFRDYKSLKMHYLSDNLTLKRRVTANQFFCAFFFRDILPKIAQPIGEQDFIKMIQEIPFNADKLVLYIKSDLEAAKEANRKDLRDLIFTIIEELLSTSPIELGENILVVYGMLAKELTENRESTFLSEKQNASYAIWRFARRLESPQAVCTLLINLLKHSISDEFLSNILFYSINQERRQDTIRLQDPCVNLIKERFLDICNKRFVNQDKTPNIFDKNVSDAPWQMLYRWSNSGGTTEIQNYLISLFSTHPDTLKIFVSNFIPSEHFGYEDKFKGLLSLISIDSLKEIIEKSPIKTDVMSIEGYAKFKAMIDKTSGSVAND